MASEGTVRRDGASEGYKAAGLSTLGFPAYDSRSWGQRVYLTGRVLAYRAWTPGLHFMCVCGCWRARTHADD